MNDYFNKFDYQNAIIGISYPNKNASDDKLLVAIFHDEKALRNRIKNIVLDVGGYVLEEVWQSKYNNYVKYDYEPFCGDSGMYRELYLPNTKTSQFAAREIILYTENILRLEQTLKLESEAR